MPPTERPVTFPIDGETLGGVLHVPAGRPLGTLVLLHGLASEHREFSDAPRALAARGWTTLAFSMRGHGASTGARGIVSRAAAVADARAALKLLAATPEAPAPYGLVGHSLGGAWAAAALAEVPEFAAGVLAAPVSRITDELAKPEERMYRAAGGVSKLKARLGFGPLVVPYKNDYPKLFHDPGLAKRAAELGFLQRTISLANVDELLAVDAPAWAARVRQPTLVLVAKYDRAVRNASSRRVYDALAGPKRWEVLDCGHSMFADLLAEEAVARVDRWFREVLVAAPGAAGEVA